MTNQSRKLEFRVGCPSEVVAVIDVPVYPPSITPCGTCGVPLPFGLAGPIKPTFRHPDGTTWFCSPECLTPEEKKHDC